MRARAFSSSFSCWAAAKVVALRSTTAANTRIGNLLNSGSGSQIVCAYAKTICDPDPEFGCKLRAHAVSPALLRAVERLVGGLDHLRRGASALAGRAGADRHRDRQVLLGRARAAALLAALGAPRPVGGAHRHAVALDRAADRLEVRQHLVELRAGEQHAELLAAVAVGDAAAAHLGEARADQLQHLVADRSEER